MITAIAAKKASQNSTAGRRRRRWRRHVTVVAAVVVVVVTATTTAATSSAVSTALMVTVTDNVAVRSIGRVCRHGIVDVVAIVIAGRYLGIVVTVAAIHVDGIRIFRIQVGKNAIVVVSVIVIGFG